MVRLVLLVFWAVAINPLADAQDERIEFFERKIRPVLAANCFECHGPKKQDSDLRLDHISFLRKEGHYGEVIGSFPSRSDHLPVGEFRNPGLTTGQSSARSMA